MNIPEMPWQAARRRFETLLDNIAIANGRLAQIAESLARPKALEPGPFVNILVFAIAGDGPNERRVTLGRSGRVDGRTTFGIRAYYDLKDVSVIVFADPERVSVTRIARGIEGLTASAGECPMAYVPLWQLGVDLFVECEAVRR